MNRLNVLFFAGIILLTACKFETGKSETALYSDPVMFLIRLPMEFKTYRQNTNRGPLEAGEYHDIFYARGPGCVRSLWLLRAEAKRIEIWVDGAEVPQVDMPAPNFFGTLLGFQPYPVHSAAVVSTPNEWVRENFGGGEPGYTSYFPIPFSDSCRIRIYAEEKGGLAAMVNWHKYADDAELTPYRFHIAHNVMDPAPPRGSQMDMADISGAGFVAGIFLGVKQKAFDDLMYHQGGMTWLIDGETDPHAIRGHNMEDDFGFTWGFHETQTPWFGSPYHKVTKLDNPVHQTPIFTYAQEAVVYRLMGPDPVSFASSLSLKTGTRPDETETVVYYYKKQNTTAPDVVSPLAWKVTGTFPCNSKEEFEAEPPEAIFSPWPDSLVADNHKLAVHEVNSDHAWLNFHPLFFTEAWTPFALTEQAVFARTKINSEQNEKVSLRLAFDDWMTLWVNGEKVATLYHDDKFKTAKIPVRLEEGMNDILLKSVNFNHLPNNRLWALSLVVSGN